MTTIREFIGGLRWLDGRPLPDTIEPYRWRIFDAVFPADGGTAFNMVLSGRAKKNWKSADLILAGLYVLTVRKSAQGQDVLLVANDEDQAGQDLDLAVKLVGCNPHLGTLLDSRVDELRRRDGRGAMQVVPALNVKGQHGRTAALIGFDEIHAYKTHDLFEALAPDPTRRDVITWITSYDSFYQQPGCPLFDFKELGKSGADPRMLFDWWSADYVTDPAAADLPPEERANPSWRSWPEGLAYLDQQKRRLPSHKFRRLHLNLPGVPAGAFLDPDAVHDAVVSDRRSLPPMRDHAYVGFVDMSGGSSDDAVVAVAHKDGDRVILDAIESQAGVPPFNPRQFVLKAATLLQRYGCRRVWGDKYAGETFAYDFESCRIRYEPDVPPKSDLYEWLEPKLNAGEVQLLDHPKLESQLLGLTFRGTKIDHLPGEHDDWANAAAGAVWAVERGGSVGEFSVNAIRGGGYADSHERTAATGGGFRIVPPSEAWREQERRRDAANAEHLRRFR